MKATDAQPATAVDRLDLGPGSHNVIFRNLLARLGEANPGALMIGDQPYGLHWLLCRPDGTGLAADGYDDTYAPPAPYLHRMWAGGRIAFPSGTEAAAEGAQVVKETTVEAITPKAGRSGRLVFVTLRHLTRMGGEVYSDELRNYVYKEEPPAEAERTFSRAPRVGNGVADLVPVPELTVVPSAMDLFQYSSLTFNSHRIHYDAVYARETEGYPNLVVHGPLTATLLLNLGAAHAGGSLAGMTVDYRARHPLFVGEAMHLSAARDTGGQLTLAAHNDDGVLCMEATVSDGDQVGR